MSTATLPPITLGKGYTFQRERSIIYGSRIQDHGYDYNRADFNWGKLVEAFYAIYESKKLPDSLPLAVTYIIQPPSKVDKVQETILNNDDFVFRDDIAFNIQNFLLYELGMSDDRDKGVELMQYLEQLLIKYAEKGFDRRKWYSMVCAVIGTELRPEIVEQADLLLNKKT